MKVKNKFKILPHLKYIGLSVAVGALTSLLIFLFKLTANFVIELSEEIYSYVRAHPVMLPALVLGAVALGAFCAFMLRFSRNCRGGGIPTAIAAIRGLITFSWVKSIYLLFFSAMLTYFGGVPLGNEGPSVQMGTAVGRGIVRFFTGKNSPYDRYIMTGGACAGFAVATGAPITGIFFAFEEAHRRFSPMLFNISAVSVIAGSALMQFLCSVSGMSYSLFHFNITAVLPASQLWIALIVGALCGFTAVGFTKLYKAVRALLQTKLQGVPFVVRVCVLFGAVSLFGFASASFIGSGHGIVDSLIEEQGIWYLLIMYLCVRAVLLVFANNIGITGGLFVPTLAFGAIIGSLVGSVGLSLGIISSEHYPIVVIIAIASVLGSFSHTPIMAIVFSVEALSATPNLLAIIIGVTFSYLIAEVLGGESFTDVVIEGKVEDSRKDKTPSVIDTRMTVGADAFVIGKEVREILWPPNCVILSVHKSKHNEGYSLSEGDVLELHYMTYDPSHTMDSLEALLGVQQFDEHVEVHEGDENDSVPEI